MGKIFPANLNRYDPYKAYRFLVYFGKSTTPVAAVSKVGAIKRSSDVIDYKRGRQRHHPEGARAHQVRADHARAGHHPGHGLRRLGQLRPGPRPGCPDARRSRTCARRSASSCWTRRPCRCCGTWSTAAWVSEFQALPDLDAGGNTIAIETIKMENEGWERDLTLTEPVEK